MSVNNFFRALWPSLFFFFGWFFTVASFLDVIFFLVLDLVGLCGLDNFLDTDELFSVLDYLMKIKT